MKKVAAVCIVLVVLVVAAVVLQSTGTIQVFGNGAAFNVKVQRIEKGNISSTVSANGEIEEIESAKVYFDTPLKVKKLYMKVNDRVQKGQKLVDLDMDSMYSELEQLKISKTVQELTIKKLNMIDTQKSTAALETAVLIAQNTVKSAESAYEESKNNYSKSKVLHKSGVLSDSELERAAKTENDSRMALDNARLNYSAAQDNLKEVRKSNLQSEANRDIDLKTQEQNMQAIVLRIEDLEKRINKIKEDMLSPIDGIITEVNLQESSFTSSVQPAFTIVVVDRLQIRAYVKEYDIKSVKVGQSVKIFGDAIDRQTAVSGRIAAISPVAVKNRTSAAEETVIEVIITVDNPASGLKPGLSVTCDILTGEKNGVLIAALEMLMEDKDGNKLVYTVNESDGTIRIKQVKLGITSDMNVEVIEGLNEGDLVVIDPQPAFRNGAKVKITEPV